MAIAYEPEPAQEQHQKPTLMLVEGGGDLVDVGTGPYNVYQGQLENHHLPIVIGKGELVVGEGSAAFNSTGAAATIGEFTLVEGADQVQVLYDVINDLSANKHLQRLEVRPQSAEEMTAKITIPPPEGWDKTTHENRQKNQFRIRFTRNHDAYNQYWANVNTVFNHPQH